MDIFKSMLITSVLGALMMTACAQSTPAAANSTPDGAVPTSTAVAVVVGGTASTSVEGGPVTSSTPDPVTQIAPTSDGQTVVTLDDRGKTINMKTGESFLLQLGEVYTWDVTISDQSVLSRVMNIAVVRGAQGVYTAHQPGTVTLTANGDPLCRQSKPPCGMPSMFFTVTVIVK